MSSRLKCISWTTWITVGKPVVTEIVVLMRNDIELGEDCYEQLHYEVLTVYFIYTQQLVNMTREILIQNNNQFKTSIDI